jgi:hypothetical protein
MSYNDIARRLTSLCKSHVNCMQASASKMADDAAVVVFAAVSNLLDSSEDEQNGTRQRTRRVRRSGRFWMHNILLQREVSGIHYDLFCYL